MQPTTIRLPEPLAADLSQEADERDLSRSEYVRHLLEYREPPPPDADLGAAGTADTAAVGDLVGEVKARLDDLEKEVSALRERRAQEAHRRRRLDTEATDTDENGDRPRPGAAEGVEAGDGGVNESQQTPGQLRLLNSLLPDSQFTDLDARNLAVEAALNLLLAAGSASRADLEGVYQDHPAGFETPGDWYETLLRPLLDRIAKTGAITQRGGRWRVDEAVTLADPSPPEQAA